MNPKIAKAISDILTEILPGWENSEETKETPKRVALAYKELFRGYSEPTFKMTTFPTKIKGMVVREGIPFASTCAHHMLPYTGFAHFGIIYEDKKLGISKMIRAIQHYSAILSSQEELTDMLVDKFETLMNPKGVIIVTEAYHMCEALRGVKVPNVATKYASFTGAFEKETTRNEFYRLIGK